VSTIVSSCNAVVVVVALAHHREQQQQQQLHRAHTTKWTRCLSALPRIRENEKKKKEIKKEWEEKRKKEKNMEREVKRKKKDQTLMVSAAAAQLQ